MNNFTEPNLHSIAWRWYFLRTLICKFERVFDVICRSSFGTVFRQTLYDTGNAHPDQPGNCLRKCRMAWFT